MPKAKPLTGFSVDYYRVDVLRPTTGRDPYTAECNDIIEALGMNYAEATVFKAVWRSCSARTLGVGKAGFENGLYDAEKIDFFANRILIQRREG